MLARHIWIALISLGTIERVSTHWFPRGRHIEKANEAILPIVKRIVQKCSLPSFEAFASRGGADSPQHAAAV